MSELNLDPEQNKIPRYLVHGKKKTSKISLMPTVPNNKMVIPMLFKMLKMIKENSNFREKFNINWTIGEKS